MKSHCPRLLPLALLLLALPFLPLARAEEAEKAAAKNDLQSMYESLRDVEIDTSRSVKVENLVIQKDITKISLTSGTIWLTKPWREGAAPTGAWFSGSGRIQMTPPNSIEKDAFKRAMEKDALDESFTQGFFRFTDDFYEVLKDRIGPAAGSADEAARLFRERQKALADLNFNLEIPVLSDVLSEGPRSELFHFQFEFPKKGWIGFLYSATGLPGGFAGESFYFRPQRAKFGETPIVTIFHDKSEYESGRDLGHEERDLFWIRHYTGEIKVDREGMMLRPKMEMDVEALDNGLKTLTFALLSNAGDDQHPFNVESLKDAKGEELEYLHKNHSLLVLLPKALKKGEKIKLGIEYNADFIRPDASIGTQLDDISIPPEFRSVLQAKLSAISQDYATFTLLNTYPWFPQAGYLKRHTFDWTVKVPTPFTAVASGTTKRRWTEEGYNCLHTTETTPVALASVLFGRYHTKTDADKRPTLHVHTLPKQQKSADDLLAESRTIITEYEKWFGPFPFDELDIAQMGFFYGFGQAPPGLVQLTGESFLSQGEMSDIFGTLSGRAPDVTFLRGFLAHEIGHEWWGHAVSWASANDQWLSESYTEYCSALYLQATRGQKAFDSKLRSWRDRASRSKDAGPIWLGFRLGRHYFTQTYDKGPYVLHMLRLALQAHAAAAGGSPADGDKIFFDSLRAFIDKFQHQNATTLDFQKVLKTTAKVDMDWFFDEWFRGNNWLNLEFKYDVRPTEDGKYLLTATFTQPDKENIKQMTVPMYIHLGKDKAIPRMIFVNKPEQTVQLKLPVSPDKVTLDDNKDILADIKYN